MSSYNYEVFVVVSAEDILGDSSYLQKSVKVLPQSDSGLMPATLSALAMARRRGDQTGAALVLSAAITATINTVDCASTPDCQQLNRYECTFLTNTCGECLDGT
jgi:hypothetical protein